MNRIPEFPRGEFENSLFRNSRFSTDVYHSHAEWYVDIWLLFEKHKESASIFAPNIPTGPDQAEGMKCSNGGSRGWGWGGLDVIDYGFIFSFRSEHSAGPGSG